MPVLRQRRMSLPLKGKEFFSSFRGRLRGGRVLFLYLDKTQENLLETALNTTAW